MAASEEVRTVGDRTYLAVDLKSFYASVECVERGLDPLSSILYFQTKSALHNILYTKVMGRDAG